MNKPLIKMTTPDDIVQLQEVLVQTALFPPDLLPDLVAPFFSGDDDAFWLTCHMNDHAVGFCYTAPEELADGTWNLRALAVLPNHQGGGLGAALTEAVEQHLRQSAQRILIVDTSGTEDFTQVRKFYAKNGYQEEARVRDFWAPGDDKVIFRKAI